MAFALNINTNYINDNTGREIELPGLLTQDGLLISHLRYLGSSRQVRRSASWRERSRFAMRLLLSYIAAHEGRFEKGTLLLEGFVQALEYGTINVKSQSDPSGLYWTPRGAEDVRTLLGHITQYTDWLAEEPQYNAPRLNPLVRASSDEERLNWCAYYQQQSNVFLNHLANPDEAKRNNATARKIQSRRPAKAGGKIAKRFPESEIKNLLENGFVLRSADPDATADDLSDYKGRAMTILMHYGGLRKSELFHLYLSDIIYDRKQKEVIVRIWHPSDGRVEFAEGYSNRRDYLNREFRLKPRTDYRKSDSQAAGWKSPLLTDGSDGYIEVVFYPLSMAKVFFHNYICYLKQQRVNPARGCEHPYAFTNTQGNPETMANFNRQHKAAVHRIGLEHAKRLGTSEHGHRHAFGYRLEEAGVSPRIIQKAMHHKNIESQEAYKEPTAADIRKAFAEREQANQNKKQE
ncbi:gamma-mobile-trio recombinase GmtY [Pseudomonas syringae]|uniref:Integrase n=3 Tax=Pseudomonas syringae TaxID=317 RepID=A0A656JI83_PSESF|nr:gamma-mobile-trio recombinase GmtY [Pseudomonas syringae]EPN26753.1 integrase [Pseudomonas syringae pv. actinidiae ICMP 19096]OOK93985.1 integrase [Pseudomonas syringae pv. actinidifoliorum]RMQ22776.1 Integrase [Pseudomonas syringae pv. actinidiae]